MNENEQAAVAVLLAKMPAFIQLRWENGPRRIYFAVKGHFQAQLAIVDEIDPLPISQLRLGGIHVPKLIFHSCQTIWERIMGRICQIRLDTAKEIFQVHDVYERVKDFLVKKLKRNRILEFLQICLP